MHLTTQKVLDLLRAYESRNLTCIEPDGSWPIVWDRARGTRVWDAEGKAYLDLTAAFGVAAAGHANRRVVLAGQTQMNRLLHAMGDVHPHALKAQLARALSRLTFERWHEASPESDARRPQASRKAPPRPASEPPSAGNPQHRGKVILCSSGFEAVEAALKTAFLATGRPGVIAFEGAYHGLGYGALNATYRDHFRSPFRLQLREFGRFVPFPDSAEALAATEKQMRRLLRGKGIGAILVEPIQVRGGVRVPPAAFLPRLRQVCDDFGVLLILDEIYTGFGRTGRWFACEHAAIAPDVICLGKALTGGFPLSACVGRADWMDTAWPPSTGEAIHTSTFHGHPVGCAMALAQIAEIEQGRLVRRSATLGEFLLAALAELPAYPERFQATVRGLGLLIGVEFCSPGGRPATTLALSVTKQMLQAGFIVLPEGEFGNVISLTPPLTITRRQLQATVDAFKRILANPATSSPKP